MNLRGLHLVWDEHIGRWSISTSAYLAPISGTVPTSKPAHGGTPMQTSVTRSTIPSSWVRSGGTLLPYVTPPKFVRGLGLRPFQYIVPNPVSPLLGMGFAVNLALLGADVTGANDALLGPTDPITGGPMAY